MSAIINIDVPDMLRAIEFYTAATECRLVRRLGDTVAELSCDTAYIYLLQKKTGGAANAGTNQTRDYSRHWTPVHIDFVVFDLEVAIAKAERAGAIRESNGETWRGATHVTFSDPFGHGFCLISFRESTYE
jgi:predicted enzyme related to lactoylglutathione lyase